MRATAEKMFEFMADEQHDGMWDALRDAGMAMLSEISQSASWDAPVRALDVRAHPTTCADVATKTQLGPPLIARPVGARSLP